MPVVSSAVGDVQRPDGVYETLVCQFAHRTSSRGDLWYGGDPLTSTVPLVLLQLVIIFATTNAVWFVTKPFKQGLFSAQLIGGIILGQSVLGRFGAFSDHVFSPGGRWQLETFADVGTTFYMFIIGAQIDLDLVKKLHRNSLVTGALCFILPLLAGLAAVAVFAVCQFDDSMEPTIKHTLPAVVFLNGISSFPDCTSLLSDLNILNSEIGRIATGASLINDICNFWLAFIFGSIAICLSNKELSAIWTVMASILFLPIMIFILTPAIVRLAKYAVDDGHEIKQTRFLFILVVVLICGLCAQVTGQPAELGAYTLGLALPDGVGSTFINKLDIITTEFLVPAKLAIIGLKMNFSSFSVANATLIGLVIIVTYATKFSVAFFMGLHYNVSGRNAVALGLIMCCKGVVVSMICFIMEMVGAITNESYTLLLVSMLIVTGFTRPLIARIYDPSTKYSTHRKNYLLKSQFNRNLRTLVCVHNVESVPTVINLLDASSPQPDQNISVSVLSLVELKGRFVPSLESASVKGCRHLSSTKSWSKHAANAFELFAERHPGSVELQQFTSHTPYSSMHDDICSMAVDMNADIVFIPFHKHWTVTGEVGANMGPIRAVNQNVLSKCPCSVGVLIDRGYLMRNHRGRSVLGITVLFLGGVDDCEALAYCYRFIDNPLVNLTFVWIRAWDCDTLYTEQMEMEAEMVNEFRGRSAGNERIMFREETVKDAIGTIKVIRSIESKPCDLCIVGRYHDPYATLVYGLTDWNEFPELGVIGGMLASPDFHFSVLVMQKEPRELALEDKAETHGLISSSYRPSTRTTIWTE